MASCSPLCSRLCEGERSLAGASTALSRSRARFLAASGSCGACGTARAFAGLEPLPAICCRLGVASVKNVKTDGWSNARSASLF